MNALLLWKKYVSYSMNHAAWSVLYDDDASLVTERPFNLKVSKSAKLLEINIEFIILKSSTWTKGPL